MISWLYQYLIINNLISDHDPIIFSIKYPFWNVIFLSDLDAVTREIQPNKGRERKQSEYISLLPHNLASSSSRIKKLAKKKKKKEK